MKDIRKIIREELEKMLYEELSHKSPIGRGKDHYVYDFKSDPSKVIKVAWGSDGNKYDPNAELKQIDLDPSHIEVFKNNKDLFPKVYKVTNRYAIIEKLNTKPIREEQTELYKILAHLDIDDFRHMREDNAIATAYRQFANRKGLLQKVMQQLIMSGVFFQSQIIQKYVNFFQTVINSPLGKMDKNIDVSDTNIGYDENGILKLLDF